MNILTFLEATTKRFPEKIAFIDEEEQITFSTLKRRIVSICSAIRTESINHPVVVLIDRNVASICVFLGIAASHNFYVPVDTLQPIERIKAIINEIHPTMIISTCKNVPEGLNLENVPILQYEDILKTKPDYDFYEHKVEEIIDTDPLYAICTSGSTGIPKVVLISHRSVLDFIPVFTRTFTLDSKDIFGNQAPFDFDVSVKDIYSGLYLGATVYIIPKECFVMPKKLMDVLDERRITVIIWAVSALCIVAGINAFKHRIPKNIKKVMFSGEVMPIKMLNIWREYLPDALFVNLYGPTEITCNCTYYVVDRVFDITEKLPIGVTFENEEVLVLNDDNRQIKVGEKGEICVRGTCLALGYYNNPEKTKESFVQNPLNMHYPEIIYRTGDLAELQTNGEYVFAARKDFQIKHMGHRIELEEIETHLGAAEGVTRASCLFDDKRNKIVAFYSGKIKKEEVITELKKKLPKYMLPNVILQKERLPLTKNGKIDRGLLQQEYYGEFTSSNRL